MINVIVIHCICFMRCDWSIACTSKRDYHAICRQIRYLLADDSVICMLTHATMQITTVCGIRWHGNKTNEQKIFVVLKFSQNFFKNFFSIVVYKSIKVSVRVISLAFDSGDKSNLDSGNSAYHKNRTQ